MTETVFVDTNLLVYARDGSEPGKQARASEWMARLWRSRTGRLSFQVLHEFYVTVTRKLKPGMDQDLARREVQNLLSWRPIPLDGTVLDGAWEVQDRFGFSFWDSLVVSAARVAGCGFLLSADLQHDQDLNGILVVNPFVRSPEEVLG